MLNDLSPMHTGSAIGLILIVLGFVALLLQKIYIGAEIATPTEIELPLLGKMKANYPALIFVFLGFGLTAYSLTKGKPIFSQWLVTGFMASDIPEINWQDGRLVVIPNNYDLNVESRSGRFTIEIDLEGTKTLEDAVKLIDYSHPKGSLQIVPSVELAAKKSGKPSKIVDDLLPPTTRNYRPIRLEPMPAN